jgi:hypothetical protein
MSTGSYSPYTVVQYLEVIDDLKVRRAWLEERIVKLEGIIPILEELEAAEIADGVEPDGVEPDGVERSLSSLQPLEMAGDWVGELRREISAGRLWLLPSVLLSSGACPSV